MTQNIKITKAISDDLAGMVALSYEKRRLYEQAQPQFWRRAKGAEYHQVKWFKTLLDHHDYILLTAKLENNLAGFLIGHIIKAPDVYDPHGKTVMVDDFCVSHPALWDSIGRKLVEVLKQNCSNKGVVQLLIVCGAHDDTKKLFLNAIDLKIASEWYVGSL